MYLFPLPRQPRFLILFPLSLFLPLGSLQGFSCPLSFLLRPAPALPLPSPAPRLPSPLFPPSNRAANEGRNVEEKKRRRVEKRRVVEMGGGNGQKSKTARERHMEKNKPPKGFNLIPLSRCLDLLEFFRFRAVFSPIDRLF